MKCLSGVPPELHFCSLLQDVCKVCTMVTIPKPTQGFSLCVQILSSSLCLNHYWSKKKKKRKKGEKLFCIAPLCTPEPSVSSPAAPMELLSGPAVVGTLIALMEIHWECVWGRRGGVLSGSLGPHVLLSTAPLEAGPREPPVSLLKIQPLSIIKCSLFEPEEVLWFQI